MGAWVWGLVWLGRGAAWTPSALPPWCSCSCLGGMRWECGALWTQALDNSTRDLGLKDTPFGGTHSRAFFRSLQ